MRCQHAGIALKDLVVQVDLSSALECLNKGAGTHGQQEAGAMYAMAALAMAGLVCTHLFSHRACGSRNVHLTTWNVWVVPHSIEFGAILRDFVRSCTIPSYSLIAYHRMDQVPSRICLHIPRTSSLHFRSIVFKRYLEKGPPNFVLCLKPTSRTVAEAAFHSQLSRESRPGVCSRSVVKSMTHSTVDVGMGRGQRSGSKASRCDVCISFAAHNISSHGKKIPDE